jgi:hypothetical protein
MKRKPKRRHKKVRAQPVRRRSSHQQLGMPTRSSDRLLREPAQATRVTAAKPESPRGNNLHTQFLIYIFVADNNETGSILYRKKGKDSRITRMAL